jgi:pantoate--beta-alanine ligase
VLRECARRLNAGSPLAPTLAEGEEQIVQAGFAVDYLEARHAETLAPIRSFKEGPIRLLVAARLGRTRLIDNTGV